MQTNSKDIWLPIYQEIHEHIRDAMKRRDQIIAFYMVLLAALIVLGINLTKFRM